MFIYLFIVCIWALLFVSKRGVGLEVLCSSTQLLNYCKRRLKFQGFRFPQTPSIFKFQVNKRIIKDTHRRHQASADYPSQDTIVLNINLVYQLQFSYQEV